MDGIGDQCQKSYKDYQHGVRVFIGESGIQDEFPS
jgi:hypothetical protein